MALSLCFAAIETNFGSSLTLLLGQYLEYKHFLDAFGDGFVNTSIVESFRGVLKTWPFG